MILFQWFYVFCEFQILDIAFGDSDGEEIFVLANNQHCYRLGRRPALREIVGTYSSADHNSMFLDLHTYFSCFVSNSKKFNSFRFLPGFTYFKLNTFDMKLL